MQILKAEDLTIAYGAVVAVKEVNFSVSEGEYVCVVGSNGSGKSSLIKGILGLVPISAGKLEFSISMENVAYLPQVNLAERDFPATVMEVVMTGTQKKAKRLPFYSKKDVEAAEKALDTLHIQDLKNKRIGQLSGGQQQRALLARALCREPKMLILDEPCAGLDSHITQEFYSMISDLNHTKGITLIMVSHDMDQVKKNAKRVLEINQTLKFDGHVDDWLAFRREEDEI